METNPGPGPVGDSGSVSGTASTSIHIQSGSSIETLSVQYLFNKYAQHYRAVFRRMQLRQTHSATTTQPIWASTVTLSVDDIDIGLGLGLGRNGFPSDPPDIAVGSVTDSATGTGTVSGSGSVSVSAPDELVSHLSLSPVQFARKLQSSSRDRRNQLCTGYCLPWNCGHGTHCTLSPIQHQTGYCIWYYIVYMWQIHHLH